MTLSKSQVRSHLVADMTVRFPARHGVFPDSLKIASLGFPMPESQREWGKQVNAAPWFTGWFTPSEFMACVTIGKVDEKPNLIDLIYNTQTRAPENAALAMEFFHAQTAAKGTTKPAAKGKAKSLAKKKKPK
jgi:hypothetical protein